MGILRAKSVIKGLTPLLLVLARDAISQNKAELPQPRIVIDHLSPRDRKFSFNVKIAPNAGDSRTAVLTVTCDPALFCSPGQQTISLSKHDPITISLNRRYGAYAAVRPATHPVFATCPVGAVVTFGR